MRSYREILCISYKDRVTNEEVCAKIQQAIGPRNDLLTIVKRRKLHMSTVHQVWPKPSCRAQRKGKEDKADRGRGGKTTLRNGQPGVRLALEGSGEQRKMEETGYDVICRAPTTRG